MGTVVKNYWCDYCCSCTSHTPESKPFLFTGAHTVTHAESCDKVCLFNPNQAFSDCNDGGKDSKTALLTPSSLSNQ